MTQQLEPARHAVGRTPDHPGGRPTGPLARAARPAGALVSALVGGVLIGAPIGTVTTAGAFFGVHTVVQGVLQLITVRESGVSRPARLLLSAGGVAALPLGAALFHGWADTCLLLGVWTGGGWLLRGLTLAVSTTSPAARPVFTCDDLLTAVIVSAGLCMTAFPFSSVGQLTGVGGSALLVTGIAEAVAAVRGPARAHRALC